MAISTFAAELRWGESAEAVAKKIDIKDFPDLIGDPNMLETTTLSDDAQTFIPGIRTMDLLTFTFNLDKTTGKAVQDDENKALFYELAFSDETTFTWQGEHTLGVPGKGVDEVIEGTINIVASTVITPKFE